ncbi:transcriptional regulator, GntR family [Colwellia chukchiensis]|uniref:Transcriptional regulator, GntR family n=1 Tax=Colwellia chukchiensis TaxID=641665 RepID=A0A1H7NKW9_9GAMM|nr:GntR family transcriptional regulator [Colwellia chukchiensis]SEL24200.1 transcriptional regulator, GntR family [Colwellia chukchiensis]
MIKSSKQVKYKELGDEIIDAILQRQYLVGDLLPTEKELCQSHDISRYTAREALRYVQNAGLVERRQGSGSRVLRNSLPNKINQFIHSVQDLFSFAEQTRFEVESCALETVSNTQVEIFSVPVGTRFVKLDGIRLESHNKKPICYSVINQFNFDPRALPEINNKRTVLHSFVNSMKSIAIGRVEQNFSATMIPNELSEKLDVPMNSVAMLIVRRYIAKDGSLLLVAESLYPACRYSYSNVLEQS